jgi:cytoplasmic iron level regulating protein YaaA (DUF328/UPF0246 family)
MLVVISPAKRLNETPATAPIGTPIFHSDAARLARIAKGLSVQDLCKLMDISPNLGTLNHARFAQFAKDPARFAAAFLFDGDTYAGLIARELAPDTLRWAQNRLRILSGLYGILKPLDAIQPYRLEMGSRLATPKGTNLYQFWGSKIARALRAEAAELDTGILINCASQEYFGAVDRAKLGLSIITPTFLETQSDGTAKVISFWAKKARGAMARHICEGHITNPTDLRGFDAGGYQYNAALSTDAAPVFTRAAVIATQA